MISIYFFSIKLADLYDQYLIHRWDLIENWSNDKLFYKNGSEEKKHLIELEVWQKGIWFYIKEILGEIEPDKIEIRKFILEKLKRNRKDPELKKIISTIIGDKVPLFGFSIIPEYYLEIFNLLSEIIEIPFYLMNPSKGFWFDIEKQDTINKKELKYLTEKNISPDLLHLDIGNSILAEMGTVGKDFFNLLYKIEGIDSNIEEEYFSSSDNNSNKNITLLETIKKDILNLTNIDKEEDKREFEYETDNSIKIVSASSKLREIEILKDYILDIFSKKDDNIDKISATDILVLAPDIEEYSSFIDLLFSNSEQKNNSSKIPYSISSKSFSASNISAAVLINILNISAGKVLSSEIFSIIDTMPIRNKFQLSNDDLDTIKGWINQTGIRWGVNSTHRKKVDDISYDENSWKQGFDQLLTGVSMFSEKEKLFSEIIPFDSINSGEAELLGKFIEITNIIFEIVELNISKNIKSKKTIEEWAVYFDQICDSLFSDGYDDDSYCGLDKLKQSISNLNRLFSFIADNNLYKTESKIEGIKNSKIEFSIISSEVINILTVNQNKDERFMLRGVTFSNLVPMRSIPFKVVCIIGMNQDKFPRVNKNSDIV